MPNLSWKVARHYDFEIRFSSDFFGQILFHLKPSWRAARFSPITILAGKS
jgi:hypothetical protein